MLWTLFGILIVVWLLAVITGNLIEGFIHILLFLALVALVIAVVRGFRGRTHT